MIDTRSENMCAMVVLAAAVFYVFYYIPSGPGAMRSSPCMARKGQEEAEEAAVVQGPQTREEALAPAVSSRRTTASSLPLDDLFNNVSDGFYEAQFPSIPKTAPRNPQALLDQKMVTKPRRTTGTEILLPGRSAEAETKKPAVTKETQWMNMPEEVADLLDEGAAAMEQ